MAKLSDIHDAFLFVSSGGHFDNVAVLCKDTGEILYRSDLGDIDEIEGKDLDLDMCIAIPHKNDLDLGQELVFEFVETYMPDGYDEVRQIFRRRGAYGRFKDFLERRGLLQKWYDFETQREEEALRDWCRENEIELSG
jgi:hypothetical protein